jgi:hypothetical protein
MDYGYLELWMQETRLQVTKRHLGPVVRKEPPPFHTHTALLGYLPIGHTSVTPNWIKLVHCQLTVPVGNIIPTRPGGIQSQRCQPAWFHARCLRTSSRIITSDARPVVGNKMAATSGKAESTGQAFRRRHGAHSVYDERRLPGKVPMFICRTCLRP